MGGPHSPAAPSAGDDSAPRKALVTDASRPVIVAVAPRRQRRLGIALMCMALMCFAVLDATAKWLGFRIGTFEVVWARYASAFVLTLIVINPWTVPNLLRTRRPGLQIARSGMLLACTLLNFVALRYLRLDQTVAIFFSTPFFISLLAGPILGEWIGWRRWVAILVGFSGVILIARPGMGGIHWSAGLCLAGAVIYSLYNISTRILASYDSSQTTLFYSNLVGFLGSSLPLPLVWTAPDDWWIIAMMVLVGALGSFGHWLLIVAHRKSPAATLAPFIYTEIIWMVIVGYLVFGDVPDAYTLAGGAIVIASGLYVLYRDQVRRKGDVGAAPLGEGR